MRENADQKNSVHGQVSRSENIALIDPLYFLQKQYIGFLTKNNYAKTTHILWSKNFYLKKFV